MIPIALKLFGVGLPSWLTKPLSYVFYGLLALAVLAGIYFAILHHGETKGAAKVAAVQAKAHAAAVITAKKDTVAAQGSMDAIGAGVTHANAQADLLLQSTIKDLHHEIATQAATADAAPDPVDTASLSASLDQRVADANGAAAAADAQP